MLVIYYAKLCHQHTRLNKYTQRCWVHTEQVLKFPGVGPWDNKKFKEIYKYYLKVALAIYIYFASVVAVTKAKESICYLQ